MSKSDRDTVTIKASDVADVSSVRGDSGIPAGSYDVADLKNRQLAAFLVAAEITPDTEGGRHMLISRFVDDLEDEWNREHRDDLKKTDCRKLFTADDVRRFAGIEEGIAENSPLPLQDRAAFANFLEIGGAGAMDASV